MTAPDVGALVAEAREYVALGDHGDHPDGVSLFAALADALEAAQRDTARLDWIDARYEWHVGRGPINTLPGVSLYYPLGTDPYDAPTLRAALDAAIAQEGGA